MNNREIDELMRENKILMSRLKAKYRMMKRKSITYILYRLDSMCIGYDIQCNNLTIGLLKQANNYGVKL